MRKLVELGVLEALEALGCGVWGVGVRHRVQGWIWGFWVLSVWLNTVNPKRSTGCDHLHVL